MQQGDIYLVPGPVRVPETIRAAYSQDFFTPVLEENFCALYNETSKLLATIMATNTSVVMLSGEAMVGLWAGLKSCLQAGDKVVAIANGVFSYGISDMAKSIGAEIVTVEFAYNTAITDYTRIEEAIKKHKPKMITAVHCETPSGILNPLAMIGKLKKQYRVPLFYVDAVASVGGAELKTDDWQIDLCLGGGQKVLSTFPDIAFLSVSNAAWEYIGKIAYQGYDALNGLQNPFQYPHFTYAQNWCAIHALNIACKLLLQEGLKNVWARHKEVAAFCRNEINKLGLELYPDDPQYSSPTVTAIKVPAKISWPELNKSLLASGLSLGGSYGPLTNKVFRIGHMGAQADLALVKRGLEILQNVL